MPDGLTMHIEGLKDLDDVFTSMNDPERVKKIINKALRKGAVIGQAAIQERAPERPELPSGTALPVGALASDVVIKTTTDDEDNYAVSIQPGKYTAAVANMVEYGHRVVVGGRSKLLSNGTTKGPGHQKRDENGELQFVPPHAYIRPAFEETADAMTEAIVSSLTESASDPKDSK